MQEQHVDKLIDHIEIEMAYYKQIPKLSEKDWAQLFAEDPKTRPSVKTAIKARIEQEEEHLQELMASKTREKSRKVDWNNRHGKDLTLHIIDDFILKTQTKINEQKKLLQGVKDYGKKVEVKPGQITQEDIIRAKETPIESFLDTEGSRKQGGRITIRCPLPGHTERTPSFTIYTHNNTYFCFGGCIHGGDSIDLVSRIHNINFIEAVKLLTR